MFPIDFFGFIISKELFMFGYVLPLILGYLGSVFFELVFCELEDELSQNRHILRWSSYAVIPLFNIYMTFRYLVTALKWFCYEYIEK